MSQLCTYREFNGRAVFAMPLDAPGYRVVGVENNVSKWPGMNPAARDGGCAGNANATKSSVPSGVRRTGRKALGNLLLPCMAASPAFATASSGLALVCPPATGS